MCESIRKHLCAVAPSPKLRDRIQKQIQAMRAGSREMSALSQFMTIKMPVRVGLNDGVVRPASYIPSGESPLLARSAPLQRAPLRGQLRVAVVMVDFTDKKMTTTHDHLDDLFFSTGKIPTGSVAEFYREVTKGLVDIVGDVIGPITLPHPIGYYANGASGTGDVQPNAQAMAEDAAKAADPQIDFTPYDNDGDGFVDAFVVVHAGSGAEETGNANDIWSHKWVLADGELNADGTKIYAYLTVPEDCKLGVCAHELGHLLFGFPDLYDTDYSSEGVGNWCLMGGGSWNGGGDTPAHPSAWCKANQAWASVTTPSGSSGISLDDVKTTGSILHISPLGADPREYFLVENRQRIQFDKDLPGDGLLIWHIDDSISGNSDERHPQVALVQADARRDLKHGVNRGDDSDPYPGSANNRAFGPKTKPGSCLYSRADSHVAITNISNSAPTMQFDLSLSTTTASGSAQKPRPRKARETAA